MNVKKIVFTTVFLAGLFCLLWGFWIPAKAVLAQILLQRAWAISLETQQPVKPWPWADSWPIGRLRQPQLGVDLIILEGASGEALAFGPGRLEGSSQLGRNEHSVIAGHRDTSFTFLKDLQHGDTIIVESLAKQNTYTVERTQIVPADELYLDTNRSHTLSLITCYPFDGVMPHTTLRYLVTATAGGM
jgi:sortase A